MVKSNKKMRKEIRPGEHQEPEGRRTWREYDIFKKMVREEGKNVEKSDERGEKWEKEEVKGSVFCPRETGII